MKVVEFKDFKKNVKDYFNQLPIIISDDGKLKYIVSDNLKAELCKNCKETLGVEEEKEVKTVIEETVKKVAIEPWVKCGYPNVVPDTTCYEFATGKYKLMNGREVFLCSHHYDQIVVKGIYVEKVA